MFHLLTQNAGQRNMMVFDSFVFFTLFENRSNMRLFQTSGVFVCFKDALYNLVITGAMTSAISLGTRVFNLSGPAALCGFRVCSLLRAPSSVMSTGGN